MDIKLTFLTVLLLTFSTLNIAQWEKQTVPDNMGMALSLDYFNSGKQIASGWKLTPESSLPGKAAIIYTTNRGIEWLPSTIFDDSAASITSVQYITENLIYASGAYWTLAVDDPKKHIINPSINNNLFLKMKKFSESKGLFSTNSLEQKGGFYKSTDGGITWNRSGNIPDSITFIIEQKFIDEQTGYLCAKGKNWQFESVLKTTDGGNSWENILTIKPETGDTNGIVDVTSFELVSDIEFIVAGNGIFNGSLKTFIYRTTNGGNDWNEISIPSSLLGQINDIAFDGTSSAYISGYEGVSGMVRTIDEGNNWFAIQPDTLNFLYTGIDVLHENTDAVITCGYLIEQANPQFIATSYDGGSSWEKNYLNGGFEPYNCYFLDNGLKYVIGGSLLQGAIYKNSDLVSVDDDNYQIPSLTSLEQNYPNPFNPSTKIHYSIPCVVETHRDAALQMVTLKVYDILGNEIATLVNEQQAPGYYEIDFNSSSLASGVYFYKLQYDNNVSVKKMIMMK